MDGVCDDTLRSPAAPQTLAWLPDTGAAESDMLLSTIVFAVSLSLLAEYAAPKETFTFQVHT